MEPDPEVERIRQELQKNHAIHVQTEIDLAITFLELSHLESRTRFTENAAKSLVHAEQAIAGARKGVNRLDSEERRAAFELRIAEIEAAIRDRKGSLPASTQA